MQRFRLPLEKTFAGGVVLYNFRFDRERTEDVLRRLNEEHVICQGWGGGDKGALRVDAPDFVSKCRDAYDLASTRIPSSLTWMREFKDGDLLVVPHLPWYGTASVHIVDGDFPACYAYREKDPLHLNHGIRVRSSYGLDGGISIYNHELTAWYGRLSGLRLPVIQAPDLEATFRTIISDLQHSPDKKLPESKLDDYLAKTLGEAVRATKERFSVMAASKSAISFEAVCEYLLHAWGYQVAGHNEYDGQGGDVDLRCVRQRTDTSPFESGETVLLVQVKKHMGTTDGWAVEQIVKMMAANPAADGCVMSLADDFTPEAKALANQHGIMLMNGDTICRLLLARLAAA